MRLFGICFLFALLALPEVASAQVNSPFHNKFLRARDNKIRKQTFGINLKPIITLAFNPDQEELRWSFTYKRKLSPRHTVRFGADWEIWKDKQPPFLSEWNTDDYKLHEFSLTAKTPRARLGYQYNFGGGPITFFTGLDLLGGYVMLKEELATTRFIKQSSCNSPLLTDCYTRDDAVSVEETNSINGLEFGGSPFIGMHIPISLRFSMDVTALLDVRYRMLDSEIQFNTLELLKLNEIETVNRGFIGDVSFNFQF